MQFFPSTCWQVTKKIELVTSLFYHLESNYLTCLSVFTLDSYSQSTSGVNIEKFSVSIYRYNRYFQYFFIISTKSVSNIKLFQCFIIIFPKLIQHLLRNFSNIFLEVFTKFHKNEKCLKYFYEIRPKFLKNFY